MDKNQPEIVYTTNDLYEAEIIKNGLESEGIVCEVDGTNQGGFVEIFDVRVLVRAEDAQRARAIIAAQAEHQPLDSPMTEPSDTDPTRRSEGEI